MSTFVQREVRCPACNRCEAAEVAVGVNAARAPHLRAAILDGSFQRHTCSCGATFAIEHPFSYVDFARRQLIFVFATLDAPRWRELEQVAARAAERNLTGAEAPAVARALGEGIAVRVVFGLDALREKLVLAERGLDDVAVEALKLARLAQGEARAIGARAHALADGRLVIVDDGGAAPLDPASLVAAAGDGFVVHRDAVSGGAFVDVARALGGPR